MPVYNTVNNSFTLTTVDAGGLPPISTTFPNYPESNMETMFGPVLLPKIYAKGLSALEIASSGAIILSINDFETLNISNNETTRQTIFQSTSNYHLKFYPNDDDKTVQVGDHTWTSETIDSIDYQVMRTSKAGGYMLSNDLVVTGALDLAGNTAFSGAVQFGSTLSIADTTFMSAGLSVVGGVQFGDLLSVSGTTYLADKLSVKDDVYMSSNLSVYGNTEIEGTLSVKDKVFFTSSLSVYGNTEIQGSLSVKGTTTMNDTLSVGGVTFLENVLSVKDNVYLTSSLSVFGNTEMEGTLSVKDKVYLTSSLSVFGNTEMEGTLSIKDDVYMSSNLSVAANSYFTGPIMKIPYGPEANRPATTAPVGSIYFNSNTFRFEGLHDLPSGNKTWLPFGGVIDTDSDTYITAEKVSGSDDDTLRFFADDADVPRINMTSSLLSINLPVEMTNTLSVQGATTLQSTLSVAHASYLSSTLSVNNIAYFNNTVKIENKLSVKNDVIFDSTLSIQDDVYMSSNLSVFGNTEMKGTLSVKDKVFFTSSLSVYGNTEIQGSLSVKGAGTIDSSLSVGGITFLENALSVKDNVYLTASLSVYGNTEMEGTLSVKNNVFLTSSLSVYGNTEMEGTLSVKGATTMNNTLSVGGITYIENTLSVKDKVYLTSSLSVYGNTEMEGSLSVKGVAYLANQLSIGDALEVNSTMNVTGAVTIENTLSVQNNVIVNPAAELFVNTIKDATNKDGTGTLTIDVETLYIKGNLDVGGTYNTVDISTSTIAVEDKLLILATSSSYDGTQDVDSQVEDGSTTNDSAGIKVAGLPSVADLNETSLSAIASSNVWEKSIKWNHNDGMQYVGYLQSDNTNDASYRDKESFWELKGGAFHLSADKFDDNGDSITVKYGFRINANDELEIIKKTGLAASKRVAKFGITSAF